MPKAPYIEMEIAAEPWKKNGLPKRILVIRLQAMGDVLITLPYLQHLRRSLPPDTVIDMLTREETADIPRSITLFNHVYAIGGGRSFKWQLIHTFLLLPKLLFRRYEVVIDLQNNLISRIIRKVIAPLAWSAFDRFSPESAGERNQNTIAAVGLGKSEADTHFKLHSTEAACTILQANGWDGHSEIVVLNPAGAFANRNWPLENYIEFSKLWVQHYPTTQFLILGIGKIAFKAEALKSALGTQLINLVNKTTPALAFSIIKRAKFVLSEDSGLMHMAWVSGVPTLAIFGSTRSDWSRPLGVHTAFLDSSDLACGNCMLEHCRHEGAEMNYCMTRHSPALLLKRALMLLNQPAEASTAGA